MAIISEPERTKFYQKVRHLLGAPLRSVELEDEMMDTLLEEVKNKALFTKLMSGWRQQKPNLTDEEGEEIFNAFARIQNGLRPDLPQVYTFLTKFDGNHGHSKFDEKNLKNLPAYTYEQIRFLIDEYSDTVREREVDAFSGRDTSATPERIEASKNLWFGSDNLIFEKDGLRVYDIKNEQMSIRYGYWYHVVYKNAKENAGQNQRINSELASAIPSIESPTLIPKHEIGIPRSVPKLESTGDARHSQFLTIAS